MKDKTVNAARIAILPRGLVRSRPLQENLVACSLAALGAFVKAGAFNRY
jgi:hypothetical protein